MHTEVLDVLSFPSTGEGGHCQEDERRELALLQPHEEQAQAPQPEPHCRDCEVPTGEHYEPLRSHFLLTS